MTKKITDETAIAVINVNIANIKTDISDVKLYIKELNTIFASKEVINEISRDISKLQSASMFWKWLSPSLAAILGSTITFLLINFLQNAK